MNTRHIIFAVVFGITSLVSFIGLIRYYRTGQREKLIFGKGPIWFNWLYAIFFAFVSLNEIFDII